MPHLALEFFFAALALHWAPQTSGTSAGLRGLSVVSDQIVWTSGTQGTVLRTLDGGEHWEIRKVEGADALDFRDVVGFDANNALILSSGSSDASRVYFTSDGGAHWKMVLVNPDKAGFFDAMKFWDRKHGILLGDPVDGHFTVFTTDNEGKTWAKVTQPAALNEEGAFAASGTCLTLYGKHDAWFGSGGPSGGRVFHTSDNGKTWRVANSPVSGDTASAGIFSIRFIDLDRGIAVGGDYQQPTRTLNTIALTNDGGHTWNAPPGAPSNEFRSAVAYLKQEKLLISVGTSGSDNSLDGGLTWKPIAKDKLNAVANDNIHVWAVGPHGLILKLILDK